MASADSIAKHDASQMPSTLEDLAESALQWRDTQDRTDLCKKLHASGISQPDDLLSTSKAVREKGLSARECEDARIMTSKARRHAHWRDVAMGIKEHIHDCG